MGEDAGITRRFFCKDRNAEFPIEFPSDLRKAIAVARDNLANGTISDVPLGGNCKPFEALISSGKWDDVLLYQFKCNSCWQLFELSAETYHGSGGWWKPVE